MNTDDIRRAKMSGIRHSSTWNRPPASGQSPTRRAAVPPRRNAVTSIVVVIATVCICTPGLSAAGPAEPDSAHFNNRCGSYCLMTALLSLDRAPEAMEQLEAVLGQPSEEGYSLQQLALAAEHFGAKAMAVQTSPDALLQRTGQFACIAHLRGNHFALLADMNKEEALVVDPPGTYPLPLPSLQSQWDGTALLISKQPLESEEALVARLRRAWLLKLSVRFAVTVLLVAVSVRAGRTILRHHARRRQLVGSAS